MTPEQAREITRRNSPVNILLEKAYYKISEAANAGEDRCYLYEYSWQYDSEYREVLEILKEQGYKMNLVNNPGNEHVTAGTSIEISWRE